MTPQRRLSVHADDRALRVRRSTSPIWWLLAYWGGWRSSSACTANSPDVRERQPPSLRCVGSRRELVFAPKKYLDRDFLYKYRIDFQQLPFQIYKAIESLEQ